MKTLTLILLLISSQSLAAPARYSVKGKCFVLAVKGSQSFVQLGTITGMSGSSCDNAYENLESACEQRAKKHGWNGSVFKDAYIKSQSDSSSMSIYAAQRRGLLFRRGAAFGFSAADSSSHTLETLPLDPSEGADCKVNTKYQQEDTETISGENYGS